MTLALVFAVSVLAAGQNPERAIPPGQLEGRPADGAASPLQARIDAAPDGARIDVEPGEYAGDLFIDRPVHLAGRGRPRLRGSGTGSVVRIRAPGVTIEGFDIDGGRGGDLGRDSSGIHVAAPRATIRDCRIVEALFGVYLRAADDAAVERSVIRGIRGRDYGEKGSGIHVYDTVGFRLTGNDIRDTRDGIYIQSATHGFVSHNTASHVRYGLHYMFSDDNTFEDNAFEYGAAGTALMYSKRIVFRRNRFVHNRGFASVGLLLKTCDDVIAEDNLIADNARGIFIEGSARNVFRRNVVALSDTAIVLYDSSSETRFETNAFVGNLSPLLLVGRRTDTRFDGNYWSEHRVPDLDGDGRSDRPFRLSSVFDHLRGNLTAADLFAAGFAAAVLAAAETTFPVLDPIRAEDQSPLAHPPPLADVPRHAAGPRRPDIVGLAGSALALAVGLVMLAGGKSRSAVSYVLNRRNRESAKSASTSARW